MLKLQKKYPTPLFIKNICRHVYLSLYKNLLEFRNIANFHSDPLLNIQFIHGRYIGFDADRVVDAVMKVKRHGAFDFLGGGLRFVYGPHEFFLYASRDRYNFS